MQLQDSLTAARHACLIRRLPFHHPPIWIAMTSPSTATIGPYPRQNCTARYPLVASVKDPEIPSSRLTQHHWRPSAPSNSISTARWPSWELRSDYHLTTDLRAGRSFCSLDGPPRPTSLLGACVAERSRPTRCTVRPFACSHSVPLAQCPLGPFLTRSQRLSADITRSPQW